MDHTETILIVATDHEFAALLGEKLIPSLGYHTITCFDGNTALQAIQAQPVAMILLERQLLDMDYLEFLHRLAARGIQLPAVLVTEHDSDQAPLETFRIGLKDYLVKPFSEESLEAALEQALSEKRLGEERARLSGELDEQLAWLAVNSKIGRNLAATHDLDEALRRIVEAAVWMTHADEGFLALPDELSGQLYLSAVKNRMETRGRTLFLPVSDSLIHTVLRSSRPLSTTRAHGDPVIKAVTGFPVHSLLYVPLFLKGKTLGVLGVDNIDTERGFTEIEQTRLVSLADYASVAIENARLYHRLQQLAITDELTGLYNRRGLFELGRREIERSQRFDRQLPALMIDIDHFKLVNDTYGHAVGDQVLRVLAQRFRRNVREIDIVCRYGGEEFVLLLLENDLETAHQVAERLQQLVSSIPIQTDAGPVRVTVSMGLTAVTADAKDLPTLLQRADEALYEAKAAGRNRIVVG